MTANVILTLEPNSSGNLVFLPGQTIKGVVKLILDHPKKVRGFYIHILGEAKCKWSEQHGSGKSRRSVSYEGKIVQINSKTYFFGSEHANTVEIAAGTFCYNFACELPLGIPETFYATIGSIEYKAIVNLDIPWGFDKKIESPFTVVRNDGIEIFPGLQSPMYLGKSTEIGCCFVACCSPPCRMEVSIPSGAYALGQSITIKVQYYNASNTKVIQTNIALRRWTKFTSSTPRVKTKEASPETMVAVNLSGVERKQNKIIEYDMEIPSFLPTSNEKFCSVVTLGYYIRVKAITNWCEYGMKVKIPIVLFRRPPIVNAPSAFLPQPSAPSIPGPSAPIIEKNDEEPPPSFDDAIGMMVKKPSQP